MRKKIPQDGLDKIIFTARQLGCCPALDENPAIPFSTQVSKWVLVICRGSLTKGQPV